MCPDPAACAAALYMRLSVEDGDGAESASITNQRALLRAYAQQHGYPVCGEYIDDGYSGTSFDRPAIRRLVADAAAGRINLILVKDLSRLGRNSARTSDLLDEFFPAHHVRFISVSDGYDSACLSGSMALATPLVTAMHEMYARDISGKIRAAFSVKIRQGQFIGSFAPYGYRKDPLDHNHLVPDPPAAKTVRLIFREAIRGQTPAQIAALLHARGLPPPLVYRRAQAASGSAQDARWSASTVRKMLKNPVYCGNMVQGKSQKPSFKSAGCRPLPRSMWVAVPDTHEPLVEPSVWASAQLALRRRAPADEKRFQNIFSGIARCADCGRCMSTVGSRKKGSAASLACGGYKQGGKRCCTNHHIAYEDLYDAVLAALQAALDLPDAARQALSAQLAALARRQAVQAAHGRRALMREEQAVRRKLARLYDDQYAGRILPEVFDTLLQDYRQQLRTLQMRQAQPAPPVRPAEDYSRRLAQLLHPQTLDPALLRLLVERIEVHQKNDGPQAAQQIEIWFRFCCAPRTLTLQNRSQTDV